MNTFIANLKYAARSQQAAEIGSGTFTPEELGTAGHNIEMLIDTLETIAMGNTDPDCMVELAQKALATLAKRLNG